MREELKALDFIQGYANVTHGYWDASRDSKVGKRLAALGGWKGYSPELDAAFEKLRAALAAEGEGAQVYWRVEHRTHPSLSEQTTPFVSREAADRRLNQLTNLFPEETPRSWKIVRVAERVEEGGE